MDSASSIFLNNNQTTAASRPTWYRLQGQIVDFKATAAEGPMYQSFYFWFVCEIMTDSIQSIVRSIVLDYTGWCHPFLVAKIDLVPHTTVAAGDSCTIGFIRIRDRHCVVIFIQHSLIRKSLASWGVIPPDARLPKMQMCSFSVGTCFTRGASLSLLGSLHTDTK